MLDAIDQAREHGELSGGFKSVADSLQAALGRLGLVTYGEKGDPFDPKIHEALTHSYSSDVAEDTCVEILQPGYKVGERILRPARVAVAEPATGPDGSSNEARMAGRRGRKLTRQRGSHERAEGTRAARAVPASQRAAVPSGPRSEEERRGKTGPRERPGGERESRASGGERRKI